MPRQPRSSLYLSRPRRRAVRFVPRQSRRNPRSPSSRRLSLNFSACRQFSDGGNPRPRIRVTPDVVSRAAGTYCCDPNALVRNLEVVTSREIQPWEEITFNYNTTEYDIADPFTC